MPNNIAMGLRFRAPMALFCLYLLLCDRDEKFAQLLDLLCCIETATGIETKQKSVEILFYEFRI